MNKKLAVVLFTIIVIMRLCTGMMVHAQETAKEKEPIYVSDVQIEAGSSGALLSDGSLYRWGHYMAYSNWEYWANKYVPEKIADDVKEFAYTGREAVIIKKNGDLYTCKTQYDYASEQETIEFEKLLTGVIDIKSIGSAFVALTEKGEIYTWGTSNYGALGNGSNESCLYPKKIMDNVKKISVNEYNVMAITNNKELYAWGSGSLGIHEYKENENTLSPVYITDKVEKAQVTSKDGWAIKTDGALYVWGYQVGRGAFSLLENLEEFYHVSKEEAYSPQKFCDNAVDAAVVSGNDNYYLILNENNNLYFGKCYFQPEIIREKVKSFEVSNNGSAISVITTNGDLYMGGYYPENNQEDSSLTELKLFVKDVGNYFRDTFTSAVIKNDGSLYMWGKNDNGQCGTIDYSEGDPMFKDEEKPIDPNKMYLLNPVKVDFSQKEIKKFELGKDNNNFKHWDFENPESGFFKVDNYGISESTQKKLFTNATSEEKSNLKKICARKWNGSCYGIAATIGMVYNNKLALKDINSSNALNYYDMEPPCRDKKLLDTIQYYYLTQYLEKGNPRSSSIALIRNPNWWQKLVGWKRTSESDIVDAFDSIIAYLNNNQMVMMLIPGHAVLICDYEKKDDGSYKFRIYDENSVSLEEPLGNFYYMNVNSDRTEFDYRGTTQENYEEFVFVDLNEIANIFSVNPRNELTSKYTTLIFPSSMPFKIRNVKGEVLINNGEELSGDIGIYDVQTLVSDGEKIEYLLKIDCDKEYTISDFQDSSDITIYNENGYASLEGKNIKDISIKIGANISITGDNYQFQSYVATQNEVIDGEKGLVRVSGEGKGRTNIFVKDKSVSITSESELINVSANTFIGTGVNSVAVPSTISPRAEIEIKADSANSEKPAIKGEKDETVNTKLDKITLFGISKKIAAGKKIKLTASVSPSNAANKAVTWSSSNPKVAKVNSSGVVTMNKKSGGKTVTITATAADGSGVKASYKITSMKGVVKKVAVSGKNTVKAGKTLKLKAKVTATKKANKKLKWTSSNEKYATVNSSGKVKALKAGKGKKVKITAMATDGSGKKKTVTIKIKK